MDNANRRGGLQAAKTLKTRYGKDWYKTLGAKGGKVCSPTKGFGSTVVGKDGLTGVQRAVKYGKFCKNIGMLD